QPPGAGGAKEPGQSNTLAPPQPRTGETGVEGAEQVPGPAGQQMTSELAQQASPPIQPPADLDALISQVNWKTDLSGGIIRVAIAHGLAPYGNGKARCFVWNYP